MKILLSLCILILLLNQKVFSQISFLGFDKVQCGIVENKKISYLNYSSMCDSHSSGYRIFSDGELIFEKCIQLTGIRLVSLQFISETTGFLVEAHANGHTVYKTVDAGKSWVAIGGGAPKYLGFFIVNENTGYLLTTYNEYIYIYRASDIKRKSIGEFKVTNDIVINDTILGSAWCNYQSLSFKIKKLNDTINYQILFNGQPLKTDNAIESFNSFYPNPVDDYIQVSQDMKTTKDGVIRISDMNGSVIRLFNNKQQKLYVGDLERGFYIIEFLDKEKRLSFKMVKN